MRSFRFIQFICTYLLYLLEGDRIPIALSRRLIWRNFPGFSFSVTYTVTCSFLLRPNIHIETPILNLIVWKSFSWFGITEHSVYLDLQLISIMLFKNVFNLNWINDFFLKAVIFDGLLIFHNIYKI